MKKKKKKRSGGLIRSLFALIIIAALIFAFYNAEDILKMLGISQTQGAPSDIVINGETVPEYTNKPYVNLNNGKPTFTESEIKTQSYEYYSELDSLGRCGVTHACIGIDLMPTEDREDIGSVTPSG